MQRAAARRTAAFRPGTVANHQRYMRSYVAFCLAYQVDDLDPNSLPTLSFFSSQA